MPCPSARGSGRNPGPSSAQNSVRLTTTQLLAILRAEGFRVTRRMLYHAIGVGSLSRPPRAGNLRRWTPLHVEALRDYLRERSRTQPDAVIGGES
jgi:hypothetical protein